MSNTKQLNFLIFMSMLYITVDLASLVFSYKQIRFQFIIGMASSIVFPITYLISDLITEVYGYKVAKNIILFGIACDFIFSFITYLLTLTPAADLYQYTIYSSVLGSLPRAIAAQTFGGIIGATINIYFMSKWKISLNGRHFWLRSIGSSVVGEGTSLIISCLVALTGVIPIKSILKIIFFAYIYKIIFAIFVAPLGQVIAILAKSNHPTNLHENNFDPSHLNMTSIY